jgi:hypothetical protein
VHVALIALDRPNALEVRKANREAHLAHVRASGIVEQAGPFLNSAGEMIGSLLILNVPDMAAAEAFAADDPYAKADLFESVTLRPWNRVIG